MPKEKKALEQLIASGKKELPSAARITAFQQARRDREFGIHWTTRGHAPAPVPVMAIGPGAETFAGTYENTEIPQKISRLMGIISPSLCTKIEYGISSSPIIPAHV